MKKKFLVSVIMPLYNVGQYLQESIESIVGQNLGFKDNIQLILVNDGSIDDTDKICRQYVDKYPDNVVYIDKKNEGVSAARNDGVAAAMGKFITFLDGDDIWSSDAFEESVKFLEGHQQVDFVASKIKFFDRLIDSHPYNYKFSTTRVIDVVKEPDSPMFHLVTCMFRREALVNRRFDVGLKISEDAKLLSEILKDKRAYGVNSKGQYNYRKRQDDSSAIGSQKRNRDFFLVTPKRAYKYMMDLWRDENGKVETFMQYQVLSDLMWRITMDKQFALTGNEERLYKETIYELIREMDTSVIVTKRDLNLRLKVFLLKIKYGDLFEKKITISKRVYLIDGVPLCNLGEKNVLFIDFIHHLGEGRYKLEGYLPQPRLILSDRYTLTTSAGVFPLRFVERAQRRISFLGDEVYDGGAFEVEVEVGDGSDTIHANLNSGSAGVKLPIVPKSLSGLTLLPGSYHQYGDRLFSIIAGELQVGQLSQMEVLKKETKRLARILFSWRLGHARDQLKRLKNRNLSLLSPRAKVFEIMKPFLVVAEAIAMIPRAWLLRIAYYVVKPFVKRPIWLVSDRGMAAGDNGESFFRHIQTRKDTYANVYFVISKKSPDYLRMKSVGKVLNQDSLYYKLIFLLSSKIISSQADVEVTNPFLRQDYHFADLFYYDFVFLQHGVIRNDLSGWLNRFNKNIKLFVTSSKMEFDSILEYPYYYTENEVILTGLPRYDRLNNNPSGKLIITPTYRKSLARKRTDANGMRAYDDQFKDSDYFRHYNQLIHDKRIIDALEKHDMVGEFYLHPALAAQVADFTSSSHIRVMDFPYDYKKALSEGSVLVTDFSSIACDFAYLKKPLVYYKFDEDEFFSQHAYDKGDFFDDETDGFGPVTRTHDEMVGEVVRAISMKGKMSKHYIGRVNKFFHRTDANNCSRAYDSIIRADKVGA